MKTAKTRLLVTSVVEVEQQVKDSMTWTLEEAEANAYEELHKLGDSIEEVVTLSVAWFDEDDKEGGLVMGGFLGNAPDGETLLAEYESYLDDIPLDDFYEVSGC